MSDAVRSKNPEGILHLLMEAEADHFKVKIRSERPLLACRVFEGKPVRQSLQLIPMLFSICSQAQSVAAVRAVENALSCPAASSVEEQREMLILLEGIREHLWRIMMDWPRIIDGYSDAAMFAPINRSLTSLLLWANPDKLATTEPGRSAAPFTVKSDFKNEWVKVRTAINRTLFSGIEVSFTDLKLPQQCESVRLLKRTIELNWSLLGDRALPALPELSSEQLTDRLATRDGFGFIAEPTWNSVCHETGPFARQRTHSAVHSVIERFGFGVYARMFARIVELIQFMALVDAYLSGARVICQKVSQSTRGLSQLEAVRGRLVHYVSIKNNKIDHFRILAPTEWNFHSQGVVSQMLSNLSPGSKVEVEKQAELLIKLIDPCVGYRLQLNLDRSGG